MKRKRTKLLFLYFKRFIVNLMVNSWSGFFVSLLSKKNIAFQGVLLPKKNLNFTQISALKLNLYESKEILFLNKHLKKDLPCVELGSSIGIVSSQICKLSKELKIFVEANPYLISTIEENLKLNKFSNYKIINAAIAYDEGDLVKFNFGNSNLTGAIKKSKKQNIVVPKTSLKAILESNAEVKEFVLVMDIEGAELDLIENEAESLKNCKQIIAEFHDVLINGKKVTFSDIKEKYLKHNFKLIDEYHNRYVFEK